MSEIRTLIVDDSSVMRKIVERSLRQAGLDPLVVYEAGSGTEGLDMLKNLKRSYEWKELARELNLRCRHQQDLEVGFFADMRAEVVQPCFLHIYADHLVKVWSNKFCDETIPAPDVQISTTF